MRLSEYLAKHPESKLHRPWRSMTPDKPLGKPVRSFASTFSAVEVLKEMFFVKKNVPVPEDQPLGEQVREFDDTLRVSDVLKKEFFEKETKSNGL